MTRLEVDDARSLCPKPQIPTDTPYTG